MSGRLLLAGIVCLLLTGLSCDTSGPEDKNVSLLTVSLAFNGPQAQGTAWPEFGLYAKTNWGIWIEDSDGNYIKTIKIDSGTVEVTGYPAHTEHLPAWLASSNMEYTGPNGYIPPELDGVTAASVLFGAVTDGIADTTISATWDFTDLNGSKVSEGTYYFHAEVANILKNTGDTTVAIVSQTASASVNYPSGATTDGTPTDNIISLTGACAF